MNSDIGEKLALRVGEIEKALAFLRVGEREPGRLPSLDSRLRALSPPRVVSPVHPRLGVPEE
jgi:hypothetical protein